MLVRSLFIIFPLMILFSAFVVEAQIYAPTSTTWSGQIIKPDTTPLEAASVDFTLEILEPDNNCILYRENHDNVDMTGSSGYFSLILGSGSRAASANYEDNSDFEDVFDNYLNLSSLTCDSGTTYSASLGDRRLLRVTFDDGTSIETLTQDLNLTSVPYALEANKVGGYEVSQLLRADAPNNVTQSNLVNVLTGTNYTELMALINGTSTQYAGDNGANFTPTSSVGFNSQRITSLAAPTSGTDAANKNYTDGNIGGSTADGTLASLAGADSGKTLQWDGAKWVAVLNDALPAIVGGDAGKVVRVNAGETGYELGTASGGADNDQSGDLVLNADNDNSGVGDDILFNINSVTQMTILNNGNVGIGVLDPDAELEIAGQIKITGGTPGAGKVLTSDADGLATWVTPSSGGATDINGLSDGINDGSSIYLGGGGAGDVGGNFNTAIGADALNANTFGTFNVASGYRALMSNTNGLSNTVTGYEAMRSNTTGGRNTASGYNALRNNTTSFDNTATGYNALNGNTTGQQNTVSGSEAMFSNTTGSGNIASGFQAGRYIANGSTANTVTNNSVYIGAETKANASGETNQVVIGYDATGIGSNTVVLGNDSIVTTALKGNVGVGVTDPDAKLEVAGQIKITGGTPGAGKVLTSDADGLATWVTPSGASGDITDVVAGNGLTGGATTGSATVTVGDGAGITVNTSDIAVNVDNTTIEINSDSLRVVAGSLDNTHIAADSIKHSVTPAGEHLEACANGEVLEWQTVTGWTCVNSSSFVDNSQSGDLVLNADSDNSGTGDDILFNINSVTQMTILNNGNVGIGVLDPDAELEIAGQIKITGGTPGAGKVLTSDADGLATWVTPSSGGATDIDGLSDAKTDTTSVFLGTNSGANDDGSNSNVGLGRDALRLNTSGLDNTAIGALALQANTTGSENTAVGRFSLFVSTTGSQNTVSGSRALLDTTTGSRNTASGYQVLSSNTIGNENTVTGYYSLFGNTTGSQNTAMGSHAGRFISDGTTANTVSDNSVFLGTATKANASGETNQIVIGFSATGLGSNTVVLGNDSIVTTALKGNVGVGTTTTNSRLTVEGVMSLKEQGSSPSDTATYGKLFVRSSDDALVYRTEAGVETDLTAGGGGATDINGLSDAKTDSFNVFLGSNAGSSDDGTNNQNVGLGINALFSNTSGERNTALGYNALSANVSGIQNVAVGALTLQSSTSSYNTAVGVGALVSTNTGGQNTAIGTRALNVTSSGLGNVAVGYDALKPNTTGSSNIAIGHSAGEKISGGSTDNTGAVQSVFLGSGTKALADSQTNQVVIGYDATGIGSNTVVLGNDSIVTTALKGNVGVGTTTTNSRLTVEGVMSLKEQGSSPSDTATYGKLFVRSSDDALVYRTEAGVETNLTAGGGGASDIDGLSDGINDGSSVFLGTGAGANDDGGNLSVGIGKDALNANISGLSNIAIGYEALKNNSTGGSNIGIGFRALEDNTSGPSNTAIGYSTLSNNTTGGNNAAIGYSALSFNTTGNFNTASGYRALASVSTGSSNTAVGYNSLQNNTAGSNTAIGSNSMSANTTGDNNTAGGLLALSSNTEGDENTGFGSRALEDNTTGVFNTAVGSRSMADNTTGNYNTALGYQSLSENIDGSYNIGIGYQALSNINSSSANQNTAVGWRAGTYITGGAIANESGSLSVFLGAHTKPNADGETNQIVIGNSATGLGSNTVVLGNDSIVTTALKGDVVIGTTTPDSTHILSVNGTASQVGGGSWATYSDERLKTVHGYFDRGLAEVMALNPIHYNYNDDNPMGIVNEGEHIGFVAQRVREVIPEAISENDKGYLMINNDPIIWTMFNAVKEVNYKCEATKEQLASIDERLKNQELQNHKQDRAIASLQEENKQLKERLKRLEELLLKNKTDK